MNRYYYDLHIHSCLSACADNDNTPYNLAGMAAVCGINIMALTDHNTCKNCPPFFDACLHYGIIPVAGMELTTAEDIHIICLFPELENALLFGNEIEKRLIKVKNNTSIFGDQIIMGQNDEIIGSEEYLLSNATDIPLEEVPLRVEKYGGICYPAHIDRQANGILATLGFMPETPVFGCVEFHDGSKAEEYIGKYGLRDALTVICSDAHFLHDIRDRENYFDLPAEPCNSDKVRKELFKKLKGNI